MKTTYRPSSSPRTYDARVIEIIHRIEDKRGNVIPMDFSGTIRDYWRLTDVSTLRAETVTIFDAGTRHRYQDVYLRTVTHGEGDDQTTLEMFDATTGRNVGAHTLNDDDEDRISYRNARPCHERELARAYAPTETNAEDVIGRIRRLLTPEDENAGVNSADFIDAVTAMIAELDSQPSRQERATRDREGLRPYLVTAERVTTYRVQATDQEDAIDAMIEGHGIEIDGDTRDITAEPEK